MINNEIKEILDKLKDGNWYNELDLTGTMWIELRWEETHLLLDYITNLQEELEEEKRINQEDLKLIDKLEEGIEKASSLIEPLVEWGECTINGKILKSVYDILNVGSDE